MVKEIEKHLKRYYNHKLKADAELEQVVELVRRHSPVFPDIFTVNDFPGDGIGIMPEHLQENGTPCYCPIWVILNAIKNGITLDEKWYSNNSIL